MGSRVLLDLMGGVALLLWGLHMVHSGIVRAFGSDVRRVLSGALRNRFRAFLAGVGITALLQSSTATALMVSSFAADGLVNLVPALAMMLGANVGTSLIVQLLSFNISAAAPVLLAIGVLAFRRGARTLIRDLGRVAIGLGLMLLSLHILIDGLAPAESAPVLHTLLASVTGEPLVNVLIGAILTWAAHSSVAMVLLVMSLAYSNFVTPVAALALVLGANLGSALNPVLEARSSDNPAAWRLPVGNLLTRVVGCVLFLPFLHPAERLLSGIDPNPVRLAADFHIAFNVVLAALFLPFLDGVSWCLQRVLPEKKRSADLGSPRYLDEAVIDVPPVALSCAARETLHMGDVVEMMLRQGMTALMTDDRKLVAEVSRLDNAIDRLHEAIKLYVIKVTRGSLGDPEARRAMEIISFSINLEHIGDIIDRNLMELAAKKLKRKLAFSKEGAAELSAMYGRVLDSLRLAFGIFLSGDVGVARQLLEQKTQFREAELAAADSHLARLREGRPESIETSSLHLDVLRDLKRIHSHVCSAAYPVLETAGELQSSRLKSAVSEAPRTSSEERTEGGPQVPAS
ncbi:MAG TPA: Na/Pi cotransporter family protein [Burkholderiales bacterium]|nr:Na/Pi cotransporter family protein [Burkholderiales bacterium]